MPLSRAAFYRLLLFLTPICFLYLFVSKSDIRSTARNTGTFFTTLTMGTGDLPKMDPKIQNLIHTVASTTKEKTTSLVTAAATTKPGANSSDQPKEAFVTFSNNQPTYLALLKIFLDSVHAFSTRPVIAYGIDVDLNINTTEYPRVIKRRIAQSDCGPVSIRQRKAHRLTIHLYSFRLVGLFL